MKTSHRFPLRLFAAATLLFTGCATNQVNWDSRVGNFTYDQAVAQLGMPDHTTTLPDGRTAADWVSRYRAASSTDMDNAFHNSAASFSTGQSTADYHESILCLIFTTNNVLNGWSKK